MKWKFTYQRREEKPKRTQRINCVAEFHRILIIPDIVNPHNVCTAQYPCRDRSNSRRIMLNCDVPLDKSHQEISSSKARFTANLFRASSSRMAGNGTRMSIICSIFFENTIPGSMIILQAGMPETSASSTLAYNSDVISLQPSWYCKFSSFCFVEGSVSCA